VQAAEFLGVSVSTIDRQASQGKLKRGRARGKTKPVTVFDRAELERLKVELQDSRSGTLKRHNPAAPPQDAVGFRLDPYYVTRLKEEGQKHGMSAGEFARHLVIQGIEGGRLRNDPSPDVQRIVATELAAFRKQLAADLGSFESRKPQGFTDNRKEVAQEVASVREALARAFFALLVMKFDTPEDEARRFVNETIRQVS
jgi:hypothetical protein